MFPPPHLSPPLKVHSFLSKESICRYLNTPRLQPTHQHLVPVPSTPIYNQCTTLRSQPCHHPPHLSQTPTIPGPTIHHLWAQINPYSPVNASPLGPNHPATHHTFPWPLTTLGPNHPPPVGPNQPNQPWPQSPHHPMQKLIHHPPHLVPTNLPSLNPITPPPWAPTHHLLAPINLVLALALGS